MVEITGSIIQWRIKKLENGDEICFLQTCLSPINSSRVESKAVPLKKEMKAMSLDAE